MGPHSRPVPACPERGEPLLTIAHLSDLHITGPACANVELTRKALAQAEVQNADLVVVTGDLSDNGTVAEVEAAVAVLAESRRCVLAVPGNHDVPSNWLGNNLLFERGASARAIATLSTSCGARPLGDGDPGWPLRHDVLGGRAVVYGLDSTVPGEGVLRWARGGLGLDQLAALDADLARLDRDQRAVIVLHHHVLPIPLGRRLKELVQGDWTMGLDDADRQQLLRILEHRAVPVVLHGHRHYFLRRRHGAAHVIAAGSTTEGCGFTGQRAVGIVRLGLNTGAVELRRVHYAAPAKRRSLEEVFAYREQMEDWVALADRALEAEDTFIAFAREFQDRASRFRSLDQVSASLDVELEALVQLAASEPSRGATGGRHRERDELVAALLRELESA